MIFSRETVGLGSPKEVNLFGVESPRSGASMKRWRRIAALVLASLALAACVLSYSNTPGPKAAVVGDSMIGLSIPVIDAALRPAYNESILGRIGFTVDGLQFFANKYAATGPDVVAIDAGTNDAFEYDSDWNGLVEVGVQHTMIVTFAATKCVVWVNLNENMPTNAPGKDVIGHAKKFNAALRYWATQLPNLRIIDWNSTVIHYGSQNILLDGIHPNATGKTVLAHLIRGALDAC